MTEIQWTDQTANPLKEGKEVKGGEDPADFPGLFEPYGNYCIPISQGCANCYASALNTKGARFGGNGRKFGVRPEGHPEMVLSMQMVNKWRNIRKARRIFVGSMTDIFGTWVQDWMLFAMLDAMDNSVATFQLLTKRPQRMSEVVGDWLRMNGKGLLPANIWVGVSAEDQRCYNERALWLGRTLAQTRFLSLEPLLGAIDITQSREIDMVDWVIVGGESGPNARPLQLEWIEDILGQCKAANIPAFVKQLGSHWAKETDAGHNKGGDPAEWPAALRVRMFPGVADGA